MTKLIYTERGCALAVDKYQIIPRIGDSVDLHVGRYKSRDDSGMRRFKVVDVIHQPGRGQIEIEVDYTGLAL